MPNRNDTVITVRVPEFLVKEVRKKLPLTGHNTISELIRDFLRQYIASETGLIYMVNVERLRKRT